VNRDRFDFSVNVKEFFQFFVTREKAKYFYVKAYCEGV
jgi:hypothetical protein